MESNPSDRADGKSAECELPCRIRGLDYSVQDVRGSAFAIGATGRIGRAAVRALAEDDWEVRAASRGGGTDGEWPEGVRSVGVDREDTGALRSNLWCRGKAVKREDL